MKQAWFVGAVVRVVKGWGTGLADGLIETPTLQGPWGILPMLHAPLRSYAPHCLPIFSPLLSPNTPRYSLYVLVHVIIFCLVSDNIFLPESLLFDILGYMHSLLDFLQT